MRVSERFRTVDECVESGVLRGRYLLVASE